MRAKFLLSGVGAGLRRNLTMTIALVLSTGIALGFVGAALLANTEITRFKQKYEDKLNVSVYLCPQTDTADAHCKHRTTAAETAAIKDLLSRDPSVRSARYVSEAEAYQRGKQQQGTQIARYLKPGDLPASFVVKLTDVRGDYPRFAATFARVTGVGQVSNQIDTINTLLTILDSARWFSIVIALVVLVASVLLIANTIQVAAAQRKNETSIMRLVGASRWMTELPFMLEVVIAAAAGGIIAIALIAVGKFYVLDNVFAGPTRNGVIPDLTTNDVLVAGGSGLVLGLILSAVTAVTTLRFRVRL